MLVTILAFLYLAIVSGLAINLHYCMGKLASVSYGHDEQDTCNKCGMANGHGCCHSETKFVKLQDDHQLVQLHYDISSPAAEASVAHNLVLAETTRIAPVFASVHSPPLISSSLYLQNCVFRI